MQCAANGKVENVKRESWSYIMALFAGYEGGFGHMVDPSYLKGQTPDKLSTCAMKKFFFKP